MSNITIGNKIKDLQFAIEVITTLKGRIYITRDSINQLIEFSQCFGCLPIFTQKFKGKKRSWVFLNPEQISNIPSLKYKITFRVSLSICINFITILKEEQQHYCFEVAKNANKHQVKKAIENIFQVKVESVRVANIRGKVKRLGRNIGKRPNWKKAYVKLKEGEKPIDFFKT